MAPLKVQNNELTFSTAGKEIKFPKLSLLCQGGGIIISRWDSRPVKVFGEELIFGISSLERFSHLLARQWWKSRPKHEKEKACQERLPG